MISTFLADDEPIALKRLTAIIQEQFSHLNIVGTASTFETTRKKLQELKPELVFLDIELGGRNSFDILEEYKFRDFEVIFVTAHENYGIKAVKQGALDYVLKPVDKADLVEAVEKATLKVYKNRLDKSPGNGKQKGEKHPGRLALPSLEGLVFVDADKILYCESDGRYTRFHLTNNKKELLVSRNLGEFENMLPPDSFVRIHNHTIVNINYVEKYVKGRGGHVVMSNGQQLPVSFRKKTDFFDKLL